MMRYTSFLFFYFFAGVVSNALSMEESQDLAIYNIAKNISFSESQLDMKSDYLRVYQRVNSLCLNTSLEELDRVKKKENLLTNRVLGAVSTGLAGVGGMQLLSAIAEEKVDEQAERQMRAYLATFKCDYANGKNIINGGETGWVLPGGNELSSLISEYKKLAMDLKLRKEALGLNPGIESEDIIDKSGTGLYEDKPIAKAEGAFVSLSNALSDENSEDAIEWTAQREEIEQKKKTGANLTGVGVIGGAIGNLGVNRK